MTNYLVKQSLITRAAHATLSLLAIAVWFLAANHCAVASFAPKAPVASAEHEGCPGHPAPAGNQESDGCDGSSCCKSLIAPFVLAKAVVSYDAFSFSTEDFPAVSGLNPGAQHVTSIEEVDTGPPGATSFAESVLQRSVLAHAPPFVV